MKKVIPFAIIATLAVGACGSSSNSSSDTTTATTAAGGGTTATTAGGGGGGATPPATGNPSAAVTLNESGSSLLYPFLQTLVSPLKTQFSNITLAPAAGGSGKGITDATSGVSQLGGSDAYLTDAELAAGLLNIPVVVSAQDVYVNLPGVKSLKLDGQTLSSIYQGKITKWNDSAISALNPGVTLPATSIYPLHRSDSSGDTFLFTSFLSKTDTSGWGGSSGPQFGTTVRWPSVANAQTASGNPGMVKTCKATPGCVAYIGISAQDTANAAGLTLVSLKNQSGQFLNANNASINSAVNAEVANVPANLAQSLIYAPGAGSYPIVNFEYLVVKKQQDSTNTAQAIRTFLTWTASPTGGSTAALLAPQHFVALPSAVVTKANAVISTIGS